MDVRCEQCQTEYELDEARVTEQGVTVKCTQCGHMFKVRRRAGTPPPAPIPTAAPPPAAPAGAPSVWLIRNNIGEIRRFKELTTLQQWIVERKVDRECEISRTGDTWKRLGEIAELASFFQLVDQADAREAARKRRLTDPVGHPTSASTGAPVAPAPAAPSAPLRHQTTRPIGTGAGAVPGPGSGPIKATPGPRQPTPPPPPAAARPGTAPAPTAGRPGGAGVPSAVNADVTGGWAAQPMAGLPAGASQRTPAFAAGGEVPVFDQNEPQFVGGPLRAPAAGGPKTGGWATTGAPPREDPGEPLDEDDLEEQPTPGPRPGGPGGPRDWRNDAEVAKKAHPPRMAAAPSRMAPEEDTLKHLKSLQVDDDSEPVDDEPLGIHPEYAPKNRTPLVIAALAVVILGGAGALWFFKLRGKPGKKPPVAGLTVDAGVAAAPLAPDASAPVVSPIARADAGSATPPVGPAQAAIARLDENTDAAWSSAETELNSLSLDAKHAAAATAGLALLELARAEARVDEAELLETDATAAQAAGQNDMAAQARRDAKRKRTEAQQGIARAKAHAARAQGLAASAPETGLAQAELALASKATPAVVERGLKTLFTAQPDDPRGLYVRAMTLLAAGKAAEAEAALAALPTLPRALYRLAVVQHRAGKTDAAITTVNALLGLQATHGRGRALLAQLQRTPLASASPSPSPGEPGTGPIGVESYDGLVARADKLAENGKTDAAVDAYKKALQAKPNGVEALSGLAYAFLDRRDYDSALAYFDAALHQSSGYSDALIGIAETYKLKGDKASAIDAYKRYIDKHPEGNKVAMARRNIVDLGGEVDSSPSPSATPEPTSAPSPTPTPTPTPESSPAPTAEPAPSPSL